MMKKLLAFLVLVAASQLSYAACTPQKIASTYGFIANATVGGFQYSIVGSLILRPDGTVLVNFVDSFGAQDNRLVGGQGTYEVRDNCTFFGSWEFPTGGNVFDGVAVAFGDLLLIQVKNQVTQITFWGFAYRRNPRSMGAMPL